MPLPGLYLVLSNGHINELKSDHLLPRDANIDK